jgi:hypothetical protein
MSERSTTAKETRGPRRWERDELRGVYLLGVLTFYAATREPYLVTLVEGSGYGQYLLFVDAVMALWAVSAFLMVFAVSGDWIGRNPASKAREGSEFCFAVSVIPMMIGLLLISIVATLTLLAYIILWFQSYTTEMIVITIIVAIVFRTQIMKYYDALRKKLLPKAKRPKA